MHRHRAGLTPAIRAGWRGRRELAPRRSATRIRCMSTRGRTDSLVLHSGPQPPPPQQQSPPQQTQPTTTTTTTTEDRTGRLRFSMRQDGARASLGQARIMMSSVLFKYNGGWKWSSLDTSGDELVPCVLAPQFASTEHAAHFKTLVDKAKDFKPYAELRR